MPLWWQEFLRLLRAAVSREVLYNNLGGQGPNISEPPVPWHRSSSSCGIEVVLYRAACFKEGRRVDVVPWP